MDQPSLVSFSWFLCLMTRVSRESGARVMACLSVINEDGPATVVANPIFPLDPFDKRTGAEFAFEILDRDASKLKTLIRGRHCFYINDSTGVFWAYVKSVQPSTGVNIMVYLPGDEVVLKAVLILMEEPAMSQ